jgi:hypothetical protein
MLLKTETNLKIENHNVFQVQETVQEICSMVQETV